MTHFLLKSRKDGTDECIPEQIENGLPGTGIGILEGSRDSDFGSHLLAGSVFEEFEDTPDHLHVKLMKDALLRR